MNANSKNKRLAWEFIKFIISEKPQLSSNLIGLPVNKAAFAEITNKSYGINADENFALTDDKDINGYNEYMGYLNSFIGECTPHIETDPTIDIMVKQEISSFLNGEKTAEETANVLQNKVSLYLNE